jgi:dihydroxy-acid dehydratase
LEVLGRKRAERITDCEDGEMEDGIARAPGHCMTMGTASTMTSIAEALGMTLPAPHRFRQLMQIIRTWRYLWAANCRNGLGGSEATRHSFSRSFKMALLQTAIGGSTTAIIHLKGCNGGTCRNQSGPQRVRRNFSSHAEIATCPSSQYLMEDFITPKRVAGTIKSNSRSAHRLSHRVSGATVGADIEGARRAILK